MPIEVAAALVGELDLMWGEQYERSKDAMHFELVTQKKPYTPWYTPDDPLAGAPPRTLELLMKNAFGSGALSLKLPTLNFVR